MVLGLIAIGFTLAVAYIWVLRGFFSALIHLLCTVAAGAVAFAVWEPVSNMLLDKSATSGFASVMSDSAWAIGLVLPFVLTLAVLRIILDVSLRAQCKLVPMADYIGGGICGLFAGIISTGILVIGIGCLRMDSEFMGYQPLVHQNTGNVTRAGGLLLPVDKFTGSIYGALSKTAFYDSEDSLGRYYPEVHLVPGSLRMNNNDGEARNTLKSGDVRVEARYTVGEGRNLPINELLSDQWNPGPQRAVDTNEKQYPVGSYIEGYVLKFNSGAKERGGDNKVMFTNAQIRLVCENKSTEETVTVFPIAVAGQADSASPQFARFRFDAKSTPMASVGGGSESTFGLDFVIPAGYTPAALFIKNARFDPRAGALAKADAQFGTPAERDSAIITGVFAPKDTVPVDTGSQVTLGNPNPGNPAQVQLPQGLTISNGIRTINKAIIRSIYVNEKNQITEGEQTFTGEELKDQGLERSLRIEQFEVTAETVMIKLDVSPGTPMSLLGPVAAAAEESAAVVVTDTDGKRYEPVGYIYDDGTKNQKTVRFYPNQPLRSLKEIPTLSRSRPNDKLTLIFRCNKGVNINSFMIGNTRVAEFVPPILLNQSQGSR